MIKEAIDRILGLNAIQITELNGHDYTREREGLIQIVPPELEPIEPLRIATLSGVVDYVAHNPDNLPVNKYFLHVESPFALSLYSPPKPGAANARDQLLIIRSKTIPFPFDKWLPIDDFILSLMVGIVPSEQLNKIILLASKVCNETIQQNEDDGFSQTLRVKTGITSKAEVALTNPIELSPYMTFPEIIPLPMFLILRFDQRRNGMHAGLFKENSGLWSYKTVCAIVDYFEGALPEINVIK